MSGWIVEPLGKHAEIRARIGWRGLSSTEYREDGPFLIAGQHIRNGRVSWGTCDHISDARYDESPEIALREGDVILSKDGTIGRVARIDSLPDRATLNGTMMLVRPRSSLDYRFLYHFLQGNSFKKLIDDKVSGSSIPHLFQRDMVSLGIAIPGIQEQAAIAAILDWLDDAIGQSETVIDKLKQLRTGLLRDMLTYGLDENGELRDPIRCPEKFHNYPCSHLPKEWSIESLGEFLKRIEGTIQTGPFGSQLHAKEYLTEGAPVIMPQDILEGSVNIAQIARISASRADDLSRHRVNPGDIIFARRGDLSRCAAITSREVGWLCGTGCLLMRFDNATLSPHWFSLAYRHDLAQRQVAARAVGTTMVNLNTKLLTHLRFAFPPIAEQQQIARIVAEADAEIHSELATVSKLALMKSALMSDLLTGRVLVPQDVEFS